MGVRGKVLSLLAATTVTTNTRVDGPPELVLDAFDEATIMLTVAAKTMNAGTTLNIYLQYSPDEGTTWDDLASFAQITNAAIPEGTYVLVLNPVPTGTGSVDRPTSDASLPANTFLNQHWCDRMRVVLVPANFAGRDTITVKINGFFRGN
ncbi:MAG: hypothetical protein ACYSVY_00050 [Planctomycetota bacterium]|jgi:hypothetical protein